MDFEKDLKSIKYKPHECSGCGEIHTAQPPVKKHFDRQKVLMIKKAAQHVMATGVNDFKKSELQLAEFGQSAYGNFPSLARYGVITMVKENGKPVRGRWLITRLGWEFVRGVKPIKSWVIVKDKHVRHEYGYGPLLYLPQLLKGADTIQTTFEYFDDNGKMIALRPSVSASMQERLF